MRFLFTILCRQTKLIFGFYKSENNEDGGGWWGLTSEKLR